MIMKYFFMYLISAYNMSWYISFPLSSATYIANEFLYMWTLGINGGFSVERPEQTISKNLQEILLQFWNLEWFYLYFEIYFDGFSVLFRIWVCVCVCEFSKDNFSTRLQIQVPIIFRHI